MVSCEAPIQEKLQGTWRRASYETGNKIIPAEIKFSADSVYTIDGRHFRQSGQNRNSFFSGHALVTSTASFFMAKVICDFHPELGAKKWLIYGAALIPPAFVGYFRVRALRHFPTDTIAATAIGATVGFLIPHFHKKKKDKGFSIDTNLEGNGLALKYRF